MIATLEYSFYLTQMVGRKVFNRGEKIGTLLDMVAIPKEPVAEVSHLMITRPMGRMSLMVPWDKVSMITSEQIVLDVPDLAAFEHLRIHEVDAPAFLLRDQILDKKVLDFEDKEVEVVYDVYLEMKDGKLYVTQADVSLNGLLRRMGMSWLAKFIATARNIEMIPWAYIEPLPEHIGSFKGNIRLKVLKDKINEMHPVDLADVLQEMDPEQRQEIFAQLDTDQASDTLEAATPRVQRDLIDSMKKERLVELLNQMTTVQAADVLGILPAHEADEILQLLNKESATRINYLIKQYDDTIMPLVTSKVIKLLPSMGVGEVVTRFRELAKNMDVNTYVYVVDTGDKLLGVAGLKELLLSEPEENLGNIMATSVINFETTITVPEAAAQFARYRFWAVPVTDEAQILKGVVLARDIMSFKNTYATPH